MSTKVLVVYYSRRVACIVAALAALGIRAEAQQADTAFEVRPFVGAYVPTGDQRAFVQEAVLAGAQLSWHAIHALAVTATYAWSQSKDRITPGNPTVDIYQYDVGAEARAADFYRATAWDFTPFAGLGLGGRAYAYSSGSVRTQSQFDGYGALGGDFGFGSLSVRIEGRDYVSRFQPATGSGGTTARNDVRIALGLGVRF